MRLERSGWDLGTATCIGHLVGTLEMVPRSQPDLPRRINKNSSDVRTDIGPLFWDPGDGSQVPYVGLVGAPGVRPGPCKGNIRSHVPTTPFQMLYTQKHVSKISEF